MWPNPQKTADLVTFTEEIFNGKYHFLVQCLVVVCMNYLNDLVIPSAYCHTLNALFLDVCLEKICKTLPKRFPKIPNFNKSTFNKKVAKKYCNFGCFLCFCGLYTFLFFSLFFTSSFLCISPFSCSSLFLFNIFQYLSVLSYLCLSTVALVTNAF